jgi:holin-like protein
MFLKPITSRCLQLCTNRSLNRIHILIQVGFLWGISIAANALATAVHSPIPGSIVGFVVLFLLLKFKVVKLSWVDRGGDFLLDNLLLFFIPAAVGIVQYGQLVRVDGVRLVGLILTSIVLVMSWTGWFAERMMKRQHRRGLPFVPCDINHDASRGARASQGASASDEATRLLPPGEPRATVGREAK